MTDIEIAEKSYDAAEKLLKECGGEVDEWVNKVCSPGGTTIQGVTSLRESDLDSVVKTAFEKSLARDKELLSGG